MDPVSFWESFALWRDPMIVAIVSAAMLAYLGVFIVLRRVVFVAANTKTLNAAWRYWKSRSQETSLVSSCSRRRNSSGT